jgi:hypothetical protein
VHALVSLALIALHALALFGWGRLIARRVGWHDCAPPLSAAIGLSWVIVLGGVLNLAGLAMPPSQSLIVALGVALSLPAFRSLRARVELGWARGLGLLTLGGVAVFTAATVLPAAMFNFRDDFEKYFAHPVRMLQTGRVSGSPLSAIGFETLGGQAWLHTFVLNLAQPDMLNAADFGLGLLLCLALAGFGSAQGRVQALARLAAMAALVLINPQIVNVSSTFTGAALCMALVLLNLPGATGAQGASRAHALVTGLVLAALCALKTSLVLLAASSGLALTIALFFHARAAGRPAARVALTWALTCASTALLGLLPWLLVHAPSYLAAIRAEPLRRAPIAMAPYALEPFSFQVYSYGTGFAPYTLAVLGCVGLGVIGFVSAARETGARGWAAHAGVALALCLAVIYLCMLYVVGPRSQGELTTLRLFVPMLLGFMPALVVVVSHTARPRAAWTGALAACLAIAPLGPFVPSLLQRASRAVVGGSLFVVRGLDAKPWYVDYNDYVLHGGMQHQVSAAQAAVPPGAPVVAWINAPFWLDFRRNPISDLDVAGLETPWSAVPRTSYVIWEFNSPVTPQVAGYESARGAASGQLQARVMDSGLRFVYTMIEVARASTVLYDDQQIMVLELPHPSALSDRYATHRRAWSSASIRDRLSHIAESSPDRPDAR